MYEIPKTEKELCEWKCPTPDTLDELRELVAGLLALQHDYRTCVYAMSLAANAAFNHVARKLGVTGFQASCADMDFMRRTRGWKGPAMILDGNDALYPQYDIHGKVREWTERPAFRRWLADEARKELASKHEHAHPDVVAHWERLAAAVPA